MALRGLLLALPAVQLEGRRRASPNALIGSTRISVYIMQKQPTVVGGVVSRRDTGGGEMPLSRALSVTKSIAWIAKACTD